MMVDLILNNRAVDVAAIGKVGSRSHVHLAPCVASRHGESLHL